MSFTWEFDPILKNVSEIRISTKDGKMFMNIKEGKADLLLPLGKIPRCSKECAGGKCGLDVDHDFECTIVDG